MWRWRVCSEISLSEPGLGVWRQQTSLAALSWALRGAQSVLRDRERSLAQSTLHRGQWASSAPAGWKTNRFVRLLFGNKKKENKERLRDAYELGPGHMEALCGLRRSFTWEKRRNNDVHLDAGSIAAPFTSFSDFFLPVLKWPMQLEGQVRFAALFIIIIIFV